MLWKFRSVALMFFLPGVAFVH